MWTTWGFHFRARGGALYLDDTPYGADPRLEFPDIDLRETLAQAGGSYPLRLVIQYEEEFVVATTLHASSGDFFLIKPPPSGGIAVNFGGLGGGPAPSESRLQLMLVRLR